MFVVHKIDILLSISFKIEFKLNWYSYVPKVICLFINECSVC